MPVSRRGANEQTRERRHVASVTDRTCSLEGLVTHSIHELTADAVGRQRKIAVAQAQPDPPLELGNFQTSNHGGRDCLQQSTATSQIGTPFR